MTKPLHVLVMGGGIGGLLLAQGLRRAGISVAVYERDRAAGSRWEGYRIHVNPAGSRSLHACLPDPLWEAFVATSGPGGDFGFLTEQLGELVVVDESIMYPDGAADAAESHYAVDRATLRRLLLVGMEDVVHFGAEFRQYEQTDDGRVAAVFADGRRAIGDVLVGADGASSRVRRQYLPQASRIDTGVGGVAQKVLLTPDSRRWIPPRLQRGMNSVIVDAPMFLFTSVYDPPPGARAALERVTGHPTPGADAPYLLLALVADRSVLPHRLTDQSPQVLRDTVDHLVTGWHPGLRRILAEADPASRSALEFGVCAEIPPWPSSRVTVLGDALHAMPPVGGLGGNTAMRDARRLCQMLVSAQREQRPLLEAIATYEEDLRHHGYAAVRAALAMQQQSLATGAVHLLAARTWFRLCAALPPLRRRTFSHGWNAVAAPRPWERADAA